MPVKKPPPGRDDKRRMARFTGGSISDDDIAAYMAAKIAENLDTVSRSDDLEEERVVLPPETIDVRAIREKLGLSQEGFARRYGFSVCSVRNWEQGRRRPEGPARILLRVIEANPEAVDEALSG